MRILSPAVFGQRLALRLRSFVQSAGTRLYDSKVEKHPDHSRREIRFSKSDRSGFALVISVVLLALLLLSLLALGSLTRVSAEIAGSGAYRTQARQNALLGLGVAIGVLQRHAGADDAITGMAGVAGAPAGANSPSRHWCGVWSGTGQFSTWLTSGATGPTWPPLDGAEAIALLANGTLGADGSDKEHVRAVIIPLFVPEGVGASVRRGGYAWWVGDEGVKLSAVVPENEAPTPSGKHATNELIATLDPMLANLAKVAVYEQLAFVPNTPLTPGQLQGNFHALGRTHRRVSGSSVVAGVLNVNSTSARYWRGLGATYNRLRPAAQLGITLTTFASRMRDNFVADTGPGKATAGPFLSVDAFLASPLLTTALAGSGVTPEEFGDAMRPWLGVRSDTFRVRAYGESSNPADPARIEAIAYCEASVQRESAELMGFGRQFRITDFRWLGPDDF